MLLILKSLVGAYVRGGRMVAGYNNKRTAHATPDDRQGDLFAGEPSKSGPGGLVTESEARAAAAEPRIALPAHPPGGVVPEGHTRKHYVTMVREPGTKAQKVGWLAGPFDSEHEARGHVEAARKKAHEVDPFSEFDAFGTSSRVAATHRPGVLNQHLGITPAAVH